MRKTEIDTQKFKPAIVYTIYIASTPEKVWQALTSAEFSKKYFFGNSVEVDLRVGGAYIVRTPDGALHISGEVVECDPPQKLTVTFNVNWPELVEKLGPTLVSLRDRTGRRSREADAARNRTTGAQRRHPLRRPQRLAGDPVEPEERAGNGKAADRADGAAAADAGCVEGDGDQDAGVAGTSLPVVPYRRPGERSIVVPAKAGTHNHRLRLSCATVVHCFLRNNIRRGVWVPAFAGTTAVCCLALYLNRSAIGRRFRSRRHSPSSPRRSRRSPAGCRSAPRCWRHG